MSVFIGGNKSKHDWLKYLMSKWEKNSQSSKRRGNILRIVTPWWFVKSIIMNIFSKRDEIHGKNVRGSREASPGNNFSSSFLW